MLLRIMTYNILNGGEGRESQILQVIRHTNPDIVILQEVFTVDFLKSLSASLDMHYYFGAGNKKRKVALLSRLPVRTFKSFHPIFPTWRNFIDAEIECQPSRAIRVIGVHPMANLGVPFEIWRSWEVGYIARYLQRYQNLPCLIAGDFNAIAPGENVKFDSMPLWLKLIVHLQGNRVYHLSIAKILSAGFVDCFRSLDLTDNGFTLPSPDPNARLDYIFANGDMKGYLKRCWVIREPSAVRLASDHCPVAAEFDLGSAVKEQTSEVSRLPLDPAGLQ